MIIEYLGPLGLYDKDNTQLEQNGTFVRDPATGFIYMVSSLKGTDQKEDGDQTGRAYLIDVVDNFKSQPITTALAGAANPKHGMFVGFPVTDTKYGKTFTVSDIESDTATKNGGKFLLCVFGHIDIQVLASCAADAELYTNAANGGEGALDDSNTSNAVRISNISLIAARAASAGLAKARVNHPFIQ